MSVWRFLPSRKTSRWSSRTVELKDTEQRVLSILDRLPVTRMVDLSPLDRLGLPVFSVVTPLAKDLTSHLGKGEDLPAARISALMEAIERCSAEVASPDSIRRGSFDQLVSESALRPVDPARFLLPKDSLYAPELELSWLLSHELGEKETVLVPSDLALNPPSEGVLHEVDTNGLASGNTHLEAVVHGLCEVVERDARSQIEFATLFGGPNDPRPPSIGVKPESLPEGPGRWVEKIRSGGLDVVILDITNDLEIPVFQTFLVDPAFPLSGSVGTQFFPGWGCAPNAESAVLRSITEAFQSRTAFIQGARDSFNISPSERRVAARLNRLQGILPVRLRCFSQSASFVSEDLVEDLAWLRERLAAVGFREVVLTDLTRPEWGIPVVRVRVPGLAVFEVNRRRIGWRCLRYLL